MSENLIATWGVSTKVDNSPYWYKGGKCEYMRYTYLELVDLAARIIFQRFPDRIDRRLSLGDCCPFWGDCDGHPEGSHSNLRTFDHNYYTMGISNTTQYRAGGPGDVEYEIVYIWEKGWMAPPEGTLLEKAFDWERNYEFWILIKSIFPHARIMSQCEIVDYVRKKVTSRYGSIYGTELFDIVEGADGGKWNHHLHAHIDLGEMINWEFDIKAWQKSKSLK